MPITISFSQPDELSTSGRRRAHTFPTTLVAAVTLLAAGALLAGATIARAQAVRPAPGAVTPRTAPSIPHMAGPVRIAHVPSVEPATDTLVVQNVGREVSRAVVAWFGDGCPRCCAAPVAVTSSPPLRPGSSWPFVPPSPSARYATVFSVLDGVEAVDVRCEDRACHTSWLVQSLKKRLPGDCAEYRRFVKAFSEGLDWFG